MKCIQIIETLSISCAFRPGRTITVNRADASSEITVQDVLRAAEDRVGARGGDRWGLVGQRRTCPAVFEETLMVFCVH